ncbi:MAG: ABC transporter ATP-binding protein [Burkholderiales bacterium]|nr:ABC transporter ATP-binding protein [Burkholderiales bacterium]
MEKLLEIVGLKTHFFLDNGVVPAIDGLDFWIGRGETVGVVGESGSGKSVTALSIMGVVPNPPGKTVEGEILFEGSDLLAYDAEQMRRIRGKEIAMILQDPMTSLNPVFTIGNQIAEVFMLHGGKSHPEAIEGAIEMLQVVGIPNPEKRVHEYPHQLSGGMRQRVMIAMALSCTPKLLIADEPTTALDVTIQAQTLALMASLKDRYKMAIMLITHNLGIVAEMCQRVVVMYAGKMMEEAEVESLFANPMHPYTRGLLRSLPGVDRKERRHQRLVAIPGIVPNLLNLPKGCRFSTRCEEHIGICKEEEPPLFARDRHRVRCWLMKD